MNEPCAMRAKPIATIVAIELAIEHNLAPLSCMLSNGQVMRISFDVPLKQIDAQEVKPPTGLPGLLITNPPYGERIGMRGDRSQEPDELATAFFSAFGSTLKQRFAGWTACLFTADLTLPRMLRLKESKKTPFFNGAIECRLFRFELVAGSNRKTSQSV